MTETERQRTAGLQSEDVREAFAMRCASFDVSSTTQLGPK
jgi:hypothetical protein